jgi:hypothetical protein
MPNRQLIQNGIDEIKDHYSYEDNHLFAMWAVTTFHYGSDMSEGTLGEVFECSHQLLNESGSGDKQLDGYYYDEGLNKLFLYQAKWPDKSTKKYGAKEAREIGGALSMLLSDCENLESLGDSRKKAATALISIKNDRGDIVLRCVSGGGWKSNLEKEVLDMIGGGINKKQVQVEFFGVEEFNKYLAQQNEGLESKVIDFKLFKGTPDPIMVYPSQDGVEGIDDSVVVLVEGESIGSSANKFGTRLFEKNVRTYLGKGRVNKDIIKALDTKELRKKFWYGHNGITILCDDYVIDDPNSPAPELIAITNPQIVNGCQTASSIGEVLKEKGVGSLTDFPVLTRIVKLVGDATQKDDVAGQIAFGTNNQSPINVADLKANDPIQKHFETLLRSYGSKWFYERKKNSWKNLSRLKKSEAKKFAGKPARVVGREEYQQAWRAYKGDPSGAVTKRNHVWQSSQSGGVDLYDEVFNTERRACDAVLVASLLEWFSQVFKTKDEASESLCTKIQSNLKGDLKRISQAKMLVAMHSVALVGYLIEKEYGGDVTKYPEQFVSTIVDTLDRKGFVERNWPKKNWEFLEKPLGLIMMTWKMYLIQEKDSEEGLQNLLKKPTAFVNLTVTLDTLYKKDDSPYMGLS